MIKMAAALSFNIGIISDDQEVVNFLVSRFRRFMLKKNDRCFEYSAKKGFTILKFSMCVSTIEEASFGAYDSFVLILKNKESVLKIDFELPIQTEAPMIIVFMIDLEDLIKTLPPLEIPFIIVNDYDSLLNAMKKIIALTVAFRFSIDKYNEILKELTEETKRKFEEIITFNTEMIEEKLNEISGLFTEDELDVVGFFLAKEKSIIIAKKYLEKFFGMKFNARFLSFDDIYSMAIYIISNVNSERKLQLESLMRKFYFASLRISDENVFGLSNTINRFLTSKKELEQFLDAVLIDNPLDKKTMNIKDRYFYDPRITDFRKNFYFPRKEESRFEEFKNGDFKFFVVIGHAGLGKTWFLANLAYKSSEKLIPLNIMNKPEYELKIAGEIDKEAMIILDGIDSSPYLDEYINLSLELPNKVLISCRLNDWLYRKEFVLFRKKVSNEIFGKELEASVVLKPFENWEIRMIIDKYNIPEEYIEYVRIPFLLGVYLRHGRIDKDVLMKNIHLLRLTLDDIALITNLMRIIKKEGGINWRSFRENIEAEKLGRIMSLGIFELDKSEVETKVVLNKELMSFVNILVQ